MLLNPSAPRPSRPVTHVKPVRFLRKRMLAQAVPDKDGVRSLTKAQRAILRDLRNAPRPVIERAIAELA